MQVVWDRIEGPMLRPLVMPDSRVGRTALRRALGARPRAGDLEDGPTSGRDHRVPLSSGALKLLEQAMALGDGDGLVFPGRWLRPNRDVAMSLLLLRSPCHGGAQARSWVPRERGSKPNHTAKTSAPLVAPTRGRAHPDDPGASADGIASLCLMRSVARKGTPWRSSFSTQRLTMGWRSPLTLI